MTSPSLSVALAQHGGSELTLRALESIRRCAYDGDLELLVFDNGSPGGPGEVAAESGVRVAVSPRNLGFSAAHNRLARVARGELLLILNNDVVLAPQALRWLVAAWRARQGRCVVCPQLRSFGGEVQEMGVCLDRAGRGWQAFRGATPPPALRGVPLAADYGSAAALLLSRDLFLGSGGFDEGYGAGYYEDVDLCMRLAAAGHPTVVEPRAVVFHLDGGTTSRMAPSVRRALFARNRARFLKGWGTALASRPPLDPGVCLDRALGGGEQGRRLLWVQPELPRPDQAGGDARAWRTIEALRRAGWQVVVWASQTAGSGRYGARLEEQGIPWFGPPAPSRWRTAGAATYPESIEELVRAVRFDAFVLWSLRTAAHFAPTLRAIRPGTPVIVDSVVLHFLQCRRARELGIPLDTFLCIEAEEELEVYRAADAVITASALERDILAGSGLAAVHAYDVGAYPPAFNGRMEPPGGEVLFLGNFLHPPNVDAVGYWADDIAPRLAARLGRAVELCLVGNGSESMAASRGWPGVRAHGWVAELGAVFAGARVFAAPLRYGAGTKDKIAVAFRYGVPTVTTSVGAESMPGGMDAAVLVGDTAEAFAGHVASLLGDEAEWRRAAERTRSAAIAAWGMQPAADRGLAAFVDRVAGGRGPRA